MSSAGVASGTSVRFCLGQLCVGAGGGVLGWYLDRLASWQQISLWFLLVLTVLFLIARRGGIAPFGPILFYDLIRSARRGRQILLRCVYLAALLAMLFLLYMNWFGGPIWGGRSAATARAWSGYDVYLEDTPSWTGRSLRPAEMAEFAEAFFATFIKVQFLVLVLITPACTAGAVAEEKERKTLEYLLSSDLNALNIVLGKLVSRLAYLALVLLTGLPVLSLLQLLGGVDPRLVLQGFAITGATVVSLACLSILNSVIAGRPRTAILLTYLEAALYLGLASLTFEATDGRGTLTTVINAGNILPGMDLFSGRAGVRVPPALGELAFLRDYALFHGTVAVLCLVTAMLLLRPLARWQASRKSRRSFAITFMPRRRPRVRGEPMIWKEMHAEPLFRFGRLTMATVGALLCGLLILGGFVFLALFVIGYVMGDLDEHMNDGVRWLGTSLACLMLLGVAVRAATCISAERDRRTLDSLLSSPLSNLAILKAKWLGCVLSVRRLWWYLGAIWLVGVLTGGLHPMAVPLLAGAWLIYAAFLASLGLTFSLFCRNATRATLWTLVTVAGLGGGHWLCGLCCNPLMTSAGTSDKGSTLLIDIQKYGLTPPLTLSFLAFYDRDVAPGLDDSPWSYRSSREWDYRDRDYSVWSSTTPRHSTCGVVLAIVLGLGSYALAAWILWAITAENFTLVTGRMPLPGSGRFTRNPFEQVHR